MKKKITILALHLGAGGAERAIVSLSNMLCEFAEVCIISTYTLTDEPAFTLDPSVKVTYLMDSSLSPNKEALKRAIKSRNLFEIIHEGFHSLHILYLKKMRMIHAIRNLDADIAISTRSLHSQWLGKYGDSNIIKIAQEHNHHHNDPRTINQVVKSLNKMDYFMPTSRYLADFYKPILAQKKVQVFFIPNCLEKFPVQMSSLQEKTMLAVGRLEQVKGFLDLIILFAKVHNILPDWHLRIVGDGSQREKLQDEINQLHLQTAVTLVGQRTGKELEKEYENSSIYLMTSFEESFGLVLLEAESYGIPLIAYDCAEGAKEIISEGKNGFLIPARNPHKYQQKMIALAENEELRKQMGNCGREMAQSYSRAKVSSQWKNFLENL